MRNVSSSWNAAWRAESGSARAAEGALDESPGLQMLPVISKYDRTFRDLRKTSGSCLRAAAPRDLMVVGKSSALLPRQAVQLLPDAPSRFPSQS